ncbi:phosphotransferase [Nonomuraea fuscirosea]|uniref:phosphotransferase n=1 Tax=Nonomuraea fuscirosea TaxID=1291556 RepID=UPI002DDC2691|nr:phosphotransferase [Nonomuraea fuscirosea]
MGSRRAAGPRFDQPRRPRGRHVGGLPQGAPCGGARRRPGQFGLWRSPQEVHRRLRTVLQAVAPGAVGDVRAVRAVRADAVAAPEWEGSVVWSHGDLHPANVVVPDGTPSGVIDSAPCSPAIPRGTSPPHGCLSPPARPHGSSTRTRTRMRGRSGAPAGRPP